MNNEGGTEFYGEVKEAIPSNAPPHRGLRVMIKIYVVSDHACNMVTRPSITGYIQFVNIAVVNWFSKKQGSIEASTFGSEFIALKTRLKKKSNAFAYHAISETCAMK
jgi:hypothetical protein